MALKVSGLSVLADLRSDQVKIDWQKWAAALSKGEPDKGLGFSSYVFSFRALGPGDYWCAVRMQGFQLLAVRHEA